MNGAALEHLTAVCASLLTVSIHVQNGAKTNSNVSPPHKLSLSPKYTLYSNRNVFAIRRRQHRE